MALPQPHGHRVASRICESHSDTEERMRHHDHGEWRQQRDDVQSDGHQQRTRAEDHARQAEVVQLAEQQRADQRPDTACCKQPTHVCDRDMHLRRERLYRRTEGSERQTERQVSDAMDRGLYQSPPVGAVLDRSISSSITAIIEGHGTAPLACESSSAREESNTLSDINLRLLESISIQTASIHI